MFIELIGEGSRPNKREAPASGSSANGDSSANASTGSGPFPAPGWGGGSSSGNSKNDLTTGATIGIIIGTIVAILVLVSVVWAFIRWRRRRGHISNVYPSLAKEELILEEGTFGRGNGMQVNPDSRSEITKVDITDDELQYTPSIPENPTSTKQNDTYPLPTHLRDSPSYSSQPHTEVPTRLNISSPTSSAMLSRMEKIGDQPHSPISTIDGLLYPEEHGTPREWTDFDQREKQ